LPPIYCAPIPACHGGLVFAHVITLEMGFKRDKIDESMGDFGLRGIRLARIDGVFIRKIWTQNIRIELTLLTRF
jgi:hypothetical protein